MPERTEVCKQEKLRAWICPVLMIIGVISSVLALLTSKFITDSLNEFWTWFRSVPVVSALFTVAIIIPLAFTVVFILVWGLWRILPPIPYVLNQVSYKCKQHTLQAIRQAIPTNIFKRTDRAVLLMVARVLSRYSSSSGEVFAVYEGGDKKILAANFAVYAECVGEIFTVAKGLVDKKKLVNKIEFFTFFKKPLQAWYNLYSTKLVCSQSDVQECHFTRLGWEKYKTGITIMKNGRTSMLRLVIPQESDKTAACHLYIDDPKKQKRLSHTEGYQYEEAKLITSETGFPLDLLKEVRNTLKQESEKNILVHLIGTCRGHVSTQQCVPLVKHFEDVYHNDSIDRRGRRNPDVFVPGVFYGYVEQETDDFSEWINWYDDIFAVRITCRKGRQLNFALAFIKDVIRGVSGVHFMPDDEVSKFINAFCSQWSESTSHFPRKEAKTGDREGSIIISP